MRCGLNQDDEWTLIQNSYTVVERKFMAISFELQQKIINRLVNSVHPEKIFLFGSHAWGHVQNDSDIDLMVILPCQKGTRHHFARQAYLALQDLGYAKDILIRSREEFEKWADVPAALEYKILTQGKLLYG